MRLPSLLRGGDPTGRFLFDWFVNESSSLRTINPLKIALRVMFEENEKGRRKIQRTLELISSKNVFLVG